MLYEVITTAGGMLTRDLYKRFINPEASHTTQKLFGRIGVVIICGLALVVATTSQDALVLLGGLAVAYGFQMWPALIGICYVPFFTRQGVTIGLIAGLIAVTLTESIVITSYSIHYTKLYELPRMPSFSWAAWLWPTASRCGLP